MKVFLGGTCNDSTWRNKLIPELKINYFNPVVEDWDEEAYKNELRERATCDICLYYITPKMTGTYSIAEVADDSNKRPEKTVFAFSDEDEGEIFDSFQIKSLDKVGKLIELNGGTYLKKWDDLVSYLNNK